MRIQRLAQLSLWATAAHAFADTSPFFIYSTSTLPDVNSLPDLQVAKSSELMPHVLSQLKSCPSDAYVVVSQPGVSAADFQDDRAPYLTRRMAPEHPTTTSKYVLPEAIGNIDTSSIEAQLMQHCGTKRVHFDERTGTIKPSDHSPQLISVDFASPPSSSLERQAQLARSDFLLETIINNISPRSFTVIFTTTPPDAEVLEIQRKEAASRNHNSHMYEWVSEMEEDTVHMDLKRDMQGHLNLNNKRQSKNESSDRGLFEKYNFFGPGIFMGLFAGLILLSIVYVGITGVAGLQVSYAAFSKEMGPKAQNKQQ